MASALGDLQDYNYELHHPSKQIDIYFDITQLIDNQNKSSDSFHDAVEERFQCFDVGSVGPGIVELLVDY